ncbi:umecyanin-like [Triticum dicoccoides]|nr:umecyanin-like [Triticum dicoccoides]XP_044390291.1 umecyanin-like isoform X2 [Triticum aestivum]
MAMAVAIRSLVAALLAGCVLLAVPAPRCAVTATDHVVGGSLWTIPTSSDHYSNWAGNRTIFAGDNLVFRFDAGMYDVVQVGQWEYNRCSWEDPYSDTLKSSPAVFHLLFADANYYVCTIANYCSLGVKLYVQVQQA